MPKRRASQAKAKAKPGLLPGGSAETARRSVTLLRTQRWEAFTGQQAENR